MELRSLDIKNEDDVAYYNAFVNKYAPPGHNMTLNYLEPLMEAYDHEVHILAAFENGVLVGVLPLVGMRSSFFGHRLVSLPFYNYGGVLSANFSTKASLIKAAKEHMHAWHYSSLVIRNVDSDPTYEQLGFSCSTDKATFFYRLPSDINKVGAGSSKKRSKLRSQALLAERRTKESGDRLRTAFGGSELLDDFYTVFSEHMRDLGTPVFSKAWFRSVLASTPSIITVVYIDEKPLATGFIFSHENTKRWSIPWASCLREGNALSLNSYMYYQILSQAIEHNIDIFDFGRSTVESGPYRFKQQWGAEPTKCHWYQYPSDNSPGPKKEGFGLAVKLWKQLPLFVANRLGPHLSRTLG